MVIIGNSSDGRRLADQLQCEYILIEQTHYPDSEVELCLSKDISDSEVIVFFQFELHKPLDAQLLNLLAALHHLQDRNIHLVTPYLPYLRSIGHVPEGQLNKVGYILPAIGELVSRLSVIQPHCTLPELKPYFPKTEVTAISIDTILLSFFKQKFNNYALVCPDGGFMDVIQRLSAQSGQPYVVLHKERHSPQEVAIAKHDSELAAHTAQNHTLVVFDDMSSTGNTLTKVAEYLQAQGTKPAATVVVHSLRSGETVVADTPYFFSNTLVHENAAIDVIPAIAQAIQQQA